MVSFYLLFSNAHFRCTGRFLTPYYNLPCLLVVQSDKVIFSPTTSNRYGPPSSSSNFLPAMSQHSSGVCSIFSHIKDFLKHVYASVPLPFRLCFIKRFHPSVSLNLKVISSLTFTQTSRHELLL